MRTYTRSDFEAARDSWQEFGPEWSELRSVMAAGGTIYAPTGSKWDQRDDPQPSQRVIVWQALDYRPEQTLDLARRSKSWRELVGRILAAEASLNEAIDLAERDDEWRRRDEPDGRQALTALGAIVGRIRDSVR